MSDTIIEVGDRVAWRSTRMNSKGLYRRVGVVLRVYSEGRFAFVKPDKGMGHAQHIALGRLTKLAAPAAAGQEVRVE